MSIEKRRKILVAATDIFSKHGYRRVNMKAIAASLGISRPGLYLYFKTKEEIFNAVVTHFGESMLEKVKEGIDSKKGLEAQLRSAFDTGVVDIFELTVKSPQAKEIAESSFEFAKTALDESFSNFATLVASILRANGVTKREYGLSSERIANILVGSARGFKLVARDQDELRKMIHDLINLTLRC